MVVEWFPPEMSELSVTVQQKQFMQQKHSRSTPKQLSISTDGVAHLHNFFILICTVQLVFHHF